MKNIDFKNLLDQLEGINKNEWELLKFEIDRKFNEMSSQNRLEGRHVDNIKKSCEKWL